MKKTAQIALNATSSVSARAFSRFLAAAATLATVGIGAVGYFAAAPDATAASLNINFVGNKGNNGSLAYADPTAYAGVGEVGDQIQAQFWNNLEGGPNSYSVLKVLQDGVANSNTGVFISYNAGQYGDGPGGGGTEAGTSAQARLIAGYLDDGPRQRVTLGNVNALFGADEWSREYTVYLIFNQDGTSKGYYTVNGTNYTAGTGTTVVGTSSWTAARHDSSVPEVLTEGTGGEYFRIVTTGNTLTIAAAEQERTGLAGVQIFTNAYTGDIVHWAGGANGTWTTSANDWATGSGGSGTLAWNNEFATRTVAAFNGTAAVTLGEAITLAEGIWVKSGDLTLTANGNTLSFGASGRILVNAGASLTFASDFTSVAVSGGIEAPSLTFGSATTLNLNASSVISEIDGTGRISRSINGITTLTVGTDADTTINATLTNGSLGNGNGLALFKTGAGKLTLTGTNNIGSNPKGDAGDSSDAGITIAQGTLSFASVLNISRNGSINMTPNIYFTGTGVALEYTGTATNEVVTYLKYTKASGTIAVTQPEAVLTLNFIRSEEESEILYKTGPGTLRLGGSNKANSWANIVLQEGVLQLHKDGGNTASTYLTLNGGLAVVTNTSSTQPIERLYLNGGTFDVNGRTLFGKQRNTNLTDTSNGIGFFGDFTGTISNTNYAAAAAAVLGGADAADALVEATADAQGKIFLSENKGSKNAWTKGTAGTLIFSGVEAVFRGDVNLNAGVLHFEKDAKNHYATLTLNADAQNNALTVGNSAKIGGDGIINARLNGGNDLNIGGYTVKTGGTYNQLTGAFDGASDTTVNGTLALAVNSPDFNGKINILSGTLSVGNGGYTGDLGKADATNAVAISSGATLLFNRDTTELSLSRPITGTGNIVKNGSNTVIFTGNVAADNVTVNTGTLTAQNLSAANVFVPAGVLNFQGGASGTATVNGTGVLNVQGGTITAATVTGTGVLNAQGGTLTTATIGSNGTLIGGAASFGTLNLGASDSDTSYFRASSAAATVTTLNANGTVYIDIIGLASFFADASSTATPITLFNYTTLNKTGAVVSAWEILDVGTYRGTFSVVDSGASNGTVSLQISNVGSAYNLVWTGQVDSSPNGTWQPQTKNWNIKDTSTAESFVTGDSVIFNDTGAVKTVTLAGNFYPATVTVGDGTDTLGQSNYTFAGPGSIGGDTTTLTKKGLGTLTLGTANTYAGGTDVQGGKITITNAAGLGVGPVSLHDGTTLDASSSGGTFANKLIAVDGTATVALADGALVLNNAFSGTGTLNFTGTGLRTFPATDSSAFSGTLQFANGADIAFTGPDADWGTAKLVNNSTSGSNILFSGVGTTKFGEITLKSGNIVVSNTLDIAKITQTGTDATSAIKRVSNTDTPRITSNTGTLAFEVTEGNTLELQVKIGGTVDIEKRGAGTLTFGGDTEQKEYRGSIHIYEGTVNLSTRFSNVAGNDLVLEKNTTVNIVKDETFGNWGGGESTGVRFTTTLKPGSLLDLKSGGTTALGIINLIGGTITLSNTGNNSGFNAQINAKGNTVAEDGAIGTPEDPTISTISGATKIGLGGKDAANNTNLITFAVEETARLNVTAPLKNRQSQDNSGNAFNKTGLGTLFLSGSNEYTGTITINAGAVEVPTLGTDAEVNTPLGKTLNSTRTINLNNEGTLRYTGTAATNADGGKLRFFIAGDGTGRIDITQAAAVVDVTQIKSGITKLGAGTLVLSGTSTPSEGVTVSGGTLLVTGSLTGDILVNGTGTLGGTDGTIVGNITVEDGGTLSPGASVGTLNVNGNVTIASGATLYLEVEYVGDHWEADTLAFDGAHTLTFEAGANLILVNLSGDAVLQDEQIINIFGTGTVPTIEGALFDGADLTTFGRPGLSFTLDKNGVLTVVIPEPSTYALLGGLGAVALALLRRRRRTSK